MKIWVKGFTRSDGVKVKGHYRETGEVATASKKTRTFVGGSGTITNTSNRKEIKKLKALGWIERKVPKEVFVKGLTGGRTYYK